MTRVLVVGCSGLPRAAESAGRAVAAGQSGGRDVPLRPPIARAGRRGAPARRDRPGRRARAGRRRCGRTPWSSTPYRYGDWAVTANGAAHVAVAAAETGARLVHLSSDAVHGGRPEPYLDDEPPSPVYPYGGAEGGGGDGGPAGASDGGGAALLVDRRRRAQQAGPALPRRAGRGRGGRRCSGIWSGARCRGGRPGLGRARTARGPTMPARSTWAARRRSTGSTSPNWSPGTTASTWGATADLPASPRAGMVRAGGGTSGQLAGRGTVEDPTARRHASSSRPAEARRFPLCSLEGPVHKVYAQLLCIDFVQKYCAEHRQPHRWVPATTHPRYGWAGAADPRSGPSAARPAARRAAQRTVRPPRPTGPTTHQHRRDQLSPAPIRRGGTGRRGARRGFGRQR